MNSLQFLCLFLVLTIGSSTLIHRLKHIQKNFIQTSYDKSGPNYLFDESQCQGWRSAQLTGYDNLDGSDDMHASYLCDGTQTNANFLSSVPVVSINSPDWDNGDAHKYVIIKRSNGQEGIAFIWDCCKDADCPDGTACCTNNAKTGGGYLVDIESRGAKKLFGITSFDSIYEKVQIRLCNHFDQNEIYNKFKNGGGDQGSEGKEDDGGSTKIECQSNQYLWQGKCYPCDQSCKTCNGWLSTNCLSCKSGMKLQGNSCVSDKQGGDQGSSTCRDHQYLDNGICKYCHWSCENCSGEGNTKCTSCPSYRTFINGRCKSKW